MRRRLPVLFLLAYGVLCLALSCAVAQAAPAVTEDDPGWNCVLQGNHQCGPARPGQLTGPLVAYSLGTALTYWAADAPALAARCPAGIPVLALTPGVAPPSAVPATAVGLAEGVGTGCTIWVAPAALRDAAQTCAIVVHEVGHLAGRGHDPDASRPSVMHAGIAPVDYPGACRPDPRTSTGGHATTRRWCSRHAVTCALSTPLLFHSTFPRGPRTPLVVAN